MVQCARVLGLPLAAVCCISSAIWQQANCFDQSEFSRTEVELNRGVVVSDPSSRQLTKIQKIYVGPLGQSDDAEIIRQTLINQLVAIPNITVVRSAADADATMEGVASLHSGNAFDGAGSSQYGFNAQGETLYSASLVLRLTDKSNKVLWISQTAPHTVPKHKTHSTFGCSPAYSLGYNTGLLIQAASKRLFGKRQQIPTANVPDTAIQAATTAAVGSLSKAIERERQQITASSHDHQI